MTTDNNPNPSNAPSTFPPDTTQVPTHPGVVAPDTDAAEQTADRLAHGANKTSQDFDRDNANLFSK